jgi:type II secretory pathway pseudopilin PulG
VPWLRRDSDDVPFVPKDDRQSRLRRGGPRTPLPLLGVIAIAAGIGVAYVNQTARATQETYQAASLQTEQQQLTSDNNKLGDQLSRLEASERIVAAAQALGMKPAGSWTYVAASPIPVLVPPSSNGNGGNQPSDPVQRVVAALGSAFGVHEGGS